MTDTHKTYEKWITYFLEHLDIHSGTKDERLRLLHSLFMDACYTREPLMVTVAPGAQSPLEYKFEYYQLIKNKVKNGQKVDLDDLWDLMRWGPAVKDASVMPRFLDIETTKNTVLIGKLAYLVGDKYDLQKRKENAGKAYAEFIARVEIYLDDRDGTKMKIKEEFFKNLEIKKLL